MNIGRVLVALLILTGSLGSLISGADFYSHLLYLGLILLIGAWVWVRIIVRSLHLSRTPEFLRASVGDIFKEQYEILNTGHLPGLWIELYNEMQIPAAAGSRLLTHVNPHEKQTYVARTR